MAQNTTVIKAPLYTDQMAISTTSVTGTRIARSALGGKRTVGFISTVDCYVKFGTASVGPATSADELYKANVPARVGIDNGSTYFSVTGTGSGSFTWYLENASGDGTDSAEGILGSLFVDGWSRQSAASATVWASRRGRLLANNGAVTFAADGSNFNGEPVIGTTAELLASMDGTVTSLAANASFPYVAAVSRFTNPGGTQALFTFGGAGDQLAAFSISGNFFARFNGGAVDITGSPIDSAVHFFELWVDGTNFNFAIDGTVRTGATASGIGEAITVVKAGSIIGGSQGSAAHSRLIVASGAPSTAQRAQLLALVKKLDNF